MKREEILALPVADLADPTGSILALWSTWMHLDLAVDTMRAWGFRHATGMPWLKVTTKGGPHFGMGIWFRGCTELLLIGRRGKITNPKPAREGIVISRRSRHSEKPQEVRDWLDQGFPEARKIELFARAEFEGWSGWGNQYPGPDGSGGILG